MWVGQGKGTEVGPAIPHGAGKISPVESLGQCGYSLP